MKTVLYLTIALFSLGFSEVQAAEDSNNVDDNWTLKRDRDDIQVYLRKVPGSPYAAVKSTMVMNGVRLSSMVALIDDAEACPDWADRCAESWVHERISNTETLVYTHNSLPFPVKDRDVVSRVHWSQDPRSLAVSMTSEAVEGIMDEMKGKVRLTHADVRWTFEPQGEGNVRITNEAHIDPGSPLPAWLTNMLLVETPFNTLKAIRGQVLKPKYRDAEISFVKEPAD